MGYDMHWEHVPEREKQSVRALREEANRVYAEMQAMPEAERGKPKPGYRDYDTNPDAWEGKSALAWELQRRMMALSDKIDATQQSYFRLNIHGMSETVKVMMAAGMVWQPETAWLADWPAPEQFLTTWEEVDKWENETEDRTLWPSSVLAFIDARQAKLAQEWPDRPGIAGHKFWTNDGYLVTPDECRSALDQWRRYAVEEGLDPAELAAKVTETLSWWTEWLRYLDGAANHGGFRVH